MKNRLHCFILKGFMPFLLCSILHAETKAQHLIFGNENTRIEVGVNFGPTFFLGDLGGHAGYGTAFIKDVNLELTKLMKGAFITVYPNEWLGLRVAAQYTYLAGRDNIINTNGVNELWRKQRNLDFKTDVWEAYGAIEIAPLMFLKRNDEEYAPRLRPYGFIGLGVFHFNPKGSITDQNGNVTWHELHPLHTEGQGFKEYPDRKEYSLTQLNVPMGAGLRYLVSDRFSVALEVLHRKTFTDYVDDLSKDYIDANYFDKYLPAADALIARKIHDKTFGIVTPGVYRYEPGTQRGNPKNNDAYFSFLLKFGITLGSDHRSGFERNSLRQTRCPARF